jgi:NAD+ kinase
MNFYIVTSPKNEKSRVISRKIEGYLLKKGQKVVGKVTDADFAITLGGDGTLIHSACEWAQARVPFVGINVGTLGFLTAFEANEWQKAVDFLISGKYIVSERMIVEARIGEGETYRAVNEFVIKGKYRVVKLDILVNDQRFLTSSGDGVIIATQTGSTAYSLSAGGPIVDPGLDCLLITPVNAHGLPIPSVVISPEDKIEVRLIDGEDVSLVIDGQEHVNVIKGQSVKVSKGEHRVKLIYFDKNHFLKALNGKFGLAQRLT